MKSGCRLCLRLQRGSGVRAWGPDELGPGRRRGEARAWREWLLQRRGRDPPQVASGTVARHLRRPWPQGMVVRVEGRAYGIDQAWITTVRVERSQARIDDFVVP